MSKKIAFLHTVPTLVPVFNDLSQELLLAGTSVFHIVDEMLLQLARSEKRLVPFHYRRVAEHAAAAEYAGAAVMQVTCSSISPCVDGARPMVQIPILKIDEAMVDRAIALGTRIGVAATLDSTLRPTSDLVQTRARSANKQVRITAAVCEGAFAALSRGDLASHDAIVLAGLEKLVAENDVIILAQASMARVAELLGPDKSQVTILASPRLAVEHLRSVLTTLSSSGDHLGGEQSP